MNTTKSSQIDLTLKNFNFDSKEVEMLHRQFSGQRSTFMIHLDDLLRCWAMAGSTDPNISFNYTLQSTIKLDHTERRVQSYTSAHAMLSMALWQKEAALSTGRDEVLLKRPTDLIKLYDLGFQSARKNADPRTIASFFSLREVFARITTQIIQAQTHGNTITLLFKDESYNYLVQFTAESFGDLPNMARILNADTGALAA